MTNLTPTRSREDLIDALMGAGDTLAKDLYREVNRRLTRMGAPTLGGDKRTVSAMLALMGTRPIAEARVTVTTEPIAQERPNADARLDALGWEPSIARRTPTHECGSLKVKADGTRCTARVTSEGARCGKHAHLPTDADVIARRAYLKAQREAYLARKAANA